MWGSMKGRGMIIIYQKAVSFENGFVVAKYSNYLATFKAWASSTQGLAVKPQAI